MNCTCSTDLTRSICQAAGIPFLHAAHCDTLTASSAPALNSDTLTTNAATTVGGTTTTGEFE